MQCFRAIRNLWFMLRFAWAGGLALQDREAKKKRADRLRRKRRKTRKKKTRLHQHERAAIKREQAIPRAVFVDDEIPIELVLPHVRKANAYIQVGDTRVLVTSKILRLLKRKGTTCVACGRIADRARVNIDRLTPYLSVGGYDDGRWFHMTVDHNIPRAQRGPNTMPNLVVMCHRCNNAKGNRTLEEFRDIMNLQRHNKK